MSIKRGAVLRTRRISFNVFTGAVFTRGPFPKLSFFCEFGPGSIQPPSTAFPIGCSTQAESFPRPTDADFPPVEEMALPVLNEVDSSSDESSSDEPPSHLNPQVAHSLVSDVESDGFTFPPLIAAFHAEWIPQPFKPGD